MTPLYVPGINDLRCIRNINIKAIMHALREKKQADKCINTSFTFIFSFCGIISAGSTVELGRDLMT